VIQDQIVQREKSLVTTTIVSIMLSVAPGQAGCGEDETDCFDCAVWIAPHGSHVWTSVGVSVWGWLLGNTGRYAKGTSDEHISILDFWWFYEWILVNLFGSGIFGTGSLFRITNPFHIFLYI